MILCALRCAHGKQDIIYRMFMQCIMHEVAIDFDGNIIVGRIERQKQDIAQTWVLKNKEMLIRKWKEMRGHV